MRDTVFMCFVVSVALLVALENQEYQPHLQPSFPLDISVLGSLGPEKGILEKYRVVFVRCSSLSWYP